MCEQLLQKKTPTTAVPKQANAQPNKANQQQKQTSKDTKHQATTD